MTTIIDTRQEIKPLILSQFQDYTMHDVDEELKTWSAKDLKGFMCLISIKPKTKEVNIEVLRKAYQYAIGLIDLNMLTATLDRYNIWSGSIK